MTPSMPTGGSLTHPSRTVLLSTDFGDASAGAEEAAIRLAANDGADLLVFHVIDPGPLRLPGGRFRQRIDQVRAEREAAAARIVRRAIDAGATARFLVWQGDPGPSILEAADAERVDVIVVGSHGRSRLGRLLLGSVSAHLVKHARLPVIVARPGEQTRYEPAGEPASQLHGGSIDA